MSARAAPPSDPPLALILVRNAVTHDNRVLREAQTLRRSGYAVLVAGVVSTDEPARHAQIDGIRIARLDPRAFGAARRRRRLPGDDAAPPTDSRAVEGAGRGGGRQTQGRAQRRLRRVAVTACYYAVGTRVCWRTAPAIVHANDYNTMWIALAAKLLRGSRVVYDCHELWPDRNGRPEWRPWLVACEALFVRAGDATITTSPGYAQTIAKRYRVPPPVIVRNIPAVRRPNDDRDLTTPARSEPLAVYLGGVMPGRGLEAAIRAVALVPTLRLRLIGPGRDSYRATLTRCAIDAGVADRVWLEPAVPPSAVIDAIADADIGLMLIEPVCRSYELTLPNKLFEYAAAGLPILASDLPVIGPLVRAEGLGEVVAVDDAEMVAAGIRRLTQASVNRQVRERVQAFAARVSWEDERAMLERVYTTVDGV